jgi:hypothetical protein
LWGVFLFDDAYAIADNLRIRQLFPIGRWMATERPVVELSLASTRHQRTQRHGVSSSA